MSARITGIASTTSISGSMATRPQALAVRPTAEQILAACRRYIAAEIHRRNALTTGRCIARIRAAEVATHLDGLLTSHVFRRGRKGGVHTGTEAAMIKAAAQAIADNWDEPHPAPANARHQGLQNLTKTVYEVLLRRQAEDTAETTPLFAA